jgi:hypothetical protein
MTSLPAFARGRASRSNSSSRFDAFTRGAFEDGWAESDPQPERRDTTLTAEKARVILSRNDSPDIGFDRSINPYRGCEHGCIYCYARPTHAYLGLSPGLDFETKLYFKPEAAQLLERELSKPGYRPARVQLGANTDPYQPVERRLLITREVVKVLARFNHPMGITTKSVLVTRDIDILGPMAERNLVVVAVSVTTLDRKLARIMEPRLDARAADRRHPPAQRGGRSGAGRRLADDPGPERSRDGGDPGAGGQGRGHERLLHRPSPAAGDQGPVPRMAGGRGSRPGRAGDVAGAPDARRQGL